MAIKGKGKPKGGSRTITPGPKPTYVPVRPPLLARRSFWTTVGAVALVLLVAGVWYGVARERAQAREAELARRLRNAALDLRSAIDPILAPLGTPTPPSGFEAFPDLRTALEDAADGGGAPADLADVAGPVAERASKAADDLEAVDAAGIVGGKGFDMAVVLNAVNARARMVQGLRLFHQAALLAADAAEQDGELAARLVTRAKDVFDLAGRVFADGYHDYVEVQLAAGVFEPVIPTG
ncbi:hypothetical protein HRbin12_00960 [bacterium HR12]|nr:hypothetical protein HRbin12_00960 [bacterium HR12]